ncbi:cupin domain-containing protein [Aquibacillus kalidii]|uniref:cupin domain-containing protein n=1 Tax=Aquibacillus kalidii TaxID=2762597 RepID=UPI0016483BF1|nr:cupin domain-containing protein [Aquibacillus kalidii]
MQKQSLASYIEYSDERFTKRVVYKEGTSTAFVLNFKPGQSLPAHKHPGTNVHLNVVQGEGVFNIDNQEVTVVERDVVVVTGDEELAFHNNSQANTSLYVVLSKIPSDEYAKDI